MARHTQRGPQINFISTPEQIERLERIAEQVNLKKSSFLRMVLDEKLTEIEEKISRGEGVHVEIV